MLYLFVLVAALGVLVYCALDVLRTPSAQVRTLPKPLWLALVVVFPLLTALPWLLFGRPQESVRPAGARLVAPPPLPVRVVHPDDDEDFLRSLRERTEEQRRRAKEQEPPTA